MMQNNMLQPDTGRQKELKRKNSGKKEEIEVESKWL
jgi:hypothetical protein